MSFYRNYRVRSIEGPQSTGSGIVIDATLRSHVNGSPTLNVGSATTWEDMRFPATAINPPGLVSDPDWDDTYGGWLFASGATEQLWVIGQMPHTYKEGSAIYPHLHWEPTNTNTGSVAWRIYYKWVNIGGTDAEPTDVLSDYDPGNGTAYMHQLSSLGSISGTGMGVSSMITIKLQRVGGIGSDTYNADCLFKEFDIHYEIDSQGSRLESSK